MPVKATVVFSACCSLIPLSCRLVVMWLSPLAHHHCAWLILCVEAGNQYRGSQSSVLPTFYSGTSDSVVREEVTVLSAVEAVEEAYILLTGAMHGISWKGNLQLLVKAVCWLVTSCCRPADTSTSNLTVVLEALMIYSRAVCSLCVLQRLWPQKSERLQWPLSTDLVAVHDCLSQ